MVCTSTALTTDLAPLERQDIHYFYQEQLGPIYRYIYSKVGNREEAEDLTSQVFLKAVCGLDAMRSLPSMRQWLFQVARTTVADYWRSWYRLPASSLDALLTEGWEGPAEEETHWSENETAERVARLLQALPQRQRDVLTCRFLLALSIRDTAKQMGLTEQNVKVLQFRALKRAAALEGIPD
ncbi:MAG TPA: sigma-70 family RNA polymerase sigma factor [Ktedonobacterales bacterium]|jgi:RNA polymerase sigma-70 factor (ECF subfamily)